MTISRRAVLGGSVAAAGLTTTASPASATIAQALGPVTASIPLRTFNFADPPTAVAVDLGTGGVSAARLVGAGPMAAITYRCVFGDNPVFPDNGADKIVIAGTDLPMGFQPALAPPPTYGVRNMWGGGWSQIMDFGRSPGVTFVSNINGWGNLGLASPLSLCDLGTPGDATSGELLPDLDDIPFGSPIAPGTVIYKHLFYEIAAVQVPPTNEDTALDEVAPDD